MLHRKRSWVVYSVADAESLAEKLTQSTWTCCQAFELGGYIFANDATCPDGAQEYAVLRGRGEPSGLVQIESITFSWCRQERALELIRRVASGEFDGNQYGVVARNRFQTAAEHRSCLHCA